MPRLPTRPDVSRAQPGPRAQALRRRCAHLVARGYAAAEIAEIEGMEAGQVEDLLGEEALGRLARAYRVIASRPPEERRAELVELARFVIDEAIGLGHVRVAFFTVREELRGRDAAETVADKLLGQWAKAAEPLLPPAPVVEAPAHRPHLPAHPADRMAQRGCRDLMRALLEEFRLRGEARLRAAREAVVAAAARRAASPPLADWRRRLTAKLLTTVAAAIPADACPPKLARAP